jgi:multidrug efflux pump subunit AcrB
VNFISFAVHRWQLSAVIFLLFAVLGIQAFFTIPRSADPHFPVPTIVTVISLPGADATAIEATIAKPIEEALQGIDRVKEIRSTSRSGVAIITTEFTYGTDADMALDRVVRDVNANRAQLPSGISRIFSRRVRTTDAVVIQLALISETTSWRRLDKYAQDIRDRVNIVSGVRRSTIFGLPKPEVRVAVDAARLSEAGIPPTAVSEAIAAGGATVATGSVNAGDRRFNVDAGGSYPTIEAVQNTLVKSDAGRFVKVGDIAEVSWAEAEHLHFTRFNGKRAVFIAVEQQDAVNAPELRDRLGEVIAESSRKLPPDMKLVTAFDQTQDIQRRLGQLGLDFVIALALVLITLIPLGFRASLVVMVSIPLSLAMGVFALAQLGFTLNQISISGFIISLGLLVDDSIVVTENIERHMRDGQGPIEASVAGTREISFAVLGSTGVLLFAFLPLTFIPEGSGDFVRGLPVAVLVTIGSSLIVSLTIIPFVASRLLKSNAHPDGNRVMRTMNGGIQRFYQPLLHWGLAHPRKTVWGSMLICLAALGSLPLLGSSLFPASDSPYFVIRVETPEGSGMAATDRAVRNVSNIVSGFPGITARMENVGRGNPQIFYNNIPREDDTRFGEIFVTIDKWSARESPMQLDELRRQFDGYPDAKVSVVQFENGPPVEAPIAIRLRGTEIESLRQAAAQVSAIMAQTPGLRDIDNPLAIERVDLDIGFKPASASLLGVSLGDVRRAVRLALVGEQASSFRDSEGDSYPVVVRLPMADNQPVTALQAIYVANQSGGSVPLGEVASPLLKSVPSQIDRFQLERTVTVKSYNDGGTLASKLNADVIAKLEKRKLPDGVTWEVGGAAEATAENTSGLGGVILFALFGIFAVLVAEFGRFREVAVVAGVIPLGLFGGIIALALSGNSVSFLAIIGFVALIGIEIKNSILLVDFTTRLREEGMELVAAVERAGEIRFLPVLLTSVTAIGGLLPLALSGSPLYAPLAWVIIGGLISSTLLSRIVTPVMYYLIARGGEQRIPDQPA